MSALRHLCRVPRSLVNHSLVRPGQLASVQQLTVGDSGVRNYSNPFGATGPITQASILALVSKMNAAERDTLRQALQRCESASPNAISQQLEGKLTSCL